MNICKITILDEVFCIISGLDDNLYKLLYNKYGIYANNYFFNPKYKLGSWDGKIRFFHQTGKTYIYLLKDIIPILLKRGYEPEVIDTRKPFKPIQTRIDKNIFSNIISPETNEPLTARDYQISIVNALLEENQGIGIAATGAGKTLICAALCKVYNQHNHRMMVITPSSDLVTQTREEFNFFGVDVGEYSGTNKVIDNDTVISTWQALKNKPQLLTDFDGVIVDECQGAKGNVIQNLLNVYGAHIPIRHGVTGTLPKGELDRLSIKATLGDVKYEIKAKALIDESWLAKPTITIKQLCEDFTDKYEEYLKETEDSPPLTYKKFKDGYFPDFTSEKKFLQVYEPRIQRIVEEIESTRLSKKGNALVLVNGVQFGKKLAKQIDNAHFIHSNDAKKIRQEVYSLFKDNDDVIVIATAQIAAVGLNIKRIFKLIYVDLGKSFVRVIQAIGRALRTAHDKDSVDIIDICSDLLYSRKHMNQRISYYKEAEYPYKKQKEEYDKKEI